MAKKISKPIVHVESDQLLVASAHWCDTFRTKLRGFTFHTPITLKEGLVLVEKGDSQITTAIHMLFVSFDLGVIWVNKAGEVVDTVVAKSWAPHYAPKAPAQYVIELHPDLLKQVKVGDHIAFEHAHA